MSTKLIHGTFIKRYKRFLVDVKLDDGQIATAHCTNSGTLKSCIMPGAPVIISPTNNPKRKTQFTWEKIKIGDTWIGVNTLEANKIAHQILKNEYIDDLKNITLIKPEVKFGDSRIDFYAEDGDNKYFIEVKNVTYRFGDYAIFPDAKTTRGQKHLRELMKAIDQGYKAAMLYIIQRNDTKIFAPAWNIDPTYGELLQEAYKKGVKIYPAQLKITQEGWQFNKLLPFTLERLPLGE